VRAVLCLWSGDLAATAAEKADGQTCEQQQHPTDAEADVAADVRLVAGKLEPGGAALLSEHVRRVGRRVRGEAGSGGFQAGQLQLGVLGTGGQLGGEHTRGLALDANQSRADRLVACQQLAGTVGDLAGAGHRSREAGGELVLACADLRQAVVQRRGAGVCGARTGVELTRAGVELTRSCVELLTTCEQLTEASADGHCAGL